LFEMFFNRPALSLSNRRNMSGVEDFKIEDNLALSVKLPSGQCISIESSPAMTVSDLKQIIMNTKKFPIAAQVIHFGKQRLSSKVRLSTYNLSPGSKLTLSMLPLDPDDFLRQINGGVLHLEVVGLAKDSGFPKDIFMSLSDIEKMAAFCVICKNVPRNTMELDCERCSGNICESCLKKTMVSFSPGGKVKCLSETCQNLIDLSESSKGRSVRKLIQRQRVKCTSTMLSDGEKCAWEGTIGELDDHIKVCNFQRISCPFNCHANVCKGSATLKGHFATCSGFFVKCRHCWEFFARREISDHESKCPEELFLCEFNCGDLLAKRDVVKHNLENLLIHVQCNRIELNIEREKRKVLEEEVTLLKCLLQRNSDFFDPDFSSSNAIISDFGRICTKSDGTYAIVGCKCLVSKGRCTFGVKLIRGSEVRVGFFPSNMKPSADPGDTYNLKQHGYGYGYRGLVHGGVIKKAGRPISVGDTIYATLDLDKAVISYKHNDRDVLMIHKVVRGCYRPGVTLFNSCSVFIKDLIIH